MAPNQILYKFTWTTRIEASSVEEAIIKLRDDVGIFSQAPFYVVENTKTGISRVLNLDTSLNYILSGQTRQTNSSL